MVHASRDTLKLAVTEARKATKRAEAACEAAKKAKASKKAQK